MPTCRLTNLFSFPTLPPPPVLDGEGLADPPVQRLHLPACLLLLLLQATELFSFFFFFSLLLFYARCIGSVVCRPSDEVCTVCYLSVKRPQKRTEATQIVKPAREVFKQREIPGEN